MINTAALEQAYQASLDKIRRNCPVIGVSFPHVAIGPHGEYNNEKPNFWTGGFWGGLLWLAYRETFDPKLLETAIALEQVQDRPLDEYMHIHHDVGFMWLPTAVAHYRQTGCPESRVRGLKAASHLMGRFNLNGRFIRAWNDEVFENSQGWAIIDCMMNIPLLYWASKELNDPRFSQVAVAHADTVLKSFLRPDGTVPHIVHFDPQTGEKIENMGGQGKSADSAWSRGQAWAIYGMAISYRETGHQRYLDAAKKVARKFWSSLPDDKVPYWDFCTEEKDTWVKDSSAACCAASGMLEIARLVDDPEESAFFTNCALELLQSMVDHCACFDDTTQGIIRYGTVSYPANRHVNVPIIYGDFFFVEALAKWKGLPGLF